MNGVHDMGGMHGFGTVPKDPAAFHADWEKTAYVMNKLLRLQGEYNIDEYRHSVERMDPAAYLGATYFERWFTGVEQLLLEKNILDPEEIEQRLAALEHDEWPPDPAGHSGPEDLRERAAESFRSGPGDLAEATNAAYDPDQTVMVRNDHPEGHTRSPRYARGAVGTVTEVLGVFALPDATAHGQDHAEPVYTVEFDAEELWGTDTDADIIALDMWESYLRET